MKAFTYYKSDNKPKLEELISVQLSIGVNKFSEAKFHIIPIGQAGIFCQFLANTTNTKIRMTRPESVLDNVTTLNGHYFNPQI